MQPSALGSGDKSDVAHLNDVVNALPTGLIVSGAAATVWFHETYYSLHFLVPVLRLVVVDEVMSAETFCYFQFCV